MQDKTLETTLLFDFFGDLLTEKQREYFDLHYNEDLSLSEIAENAGISRQGVLDMIRRAERTLEDTEKKTGIVRRFTDMNSALSDIEKELCCLSEKTDGETKKTVLDILSKLQKLKG